MPPAKCGGTMPYSVSQRETAESSTSVSCFKFGKEDPGKDIQPSLQDDFILDRL